jgi:hypothetical protein
MPSPVGAGEATSSTHTTDENVADTATPAAPVNCRRNSLDLLRAMMEADPETVANVAWTAMKEGRDVRAITARGMGDLGIGGRPFACSTVFRRGSCRDSAR